MPFPTPIERVDKPRGIVSALPPPSAAEATCKRQGRTQRRTHTPTDLARIYRYVVGSHGWKAATCSILKESGIQEFVSGNMERFGQVGLCELSIDVSGFLDDLPPGWVESADELLEVPRGTVQDSLDGCDQEIDSVQSMFRAALGGLILLWGLWRKVKLSRLYRIVLRRFLIFTAAFIILDKLEGVLERLIPALAILSVITQEITGVCVNGEADDTEGSA